MNKDTKLIKLILDNLQKLNEKKKKLSPKQKKIAQAAPPPDEITGADFKALKSKKNETLEDILEAYIKLNEKKTDPKPNDYQKKKYKARGKRGKDMAKASELYKNNPNDPRIWKIRADSEEKERKKKGYKTRKRPDSKKENLSIKELRKIIMEVLEGEMLNSTIDETAAEIEEGKGLSAKTKATLKKKAEERGLTPSSVYAEFKKGLAAWGSSGSRKGMSQHQWAYARVNSAKPSKKWSVVKKAKKKKGGKKK